MAVAWPPVRGSSGRFVRSLGSVRSSVRAEAVRGGRMAAGPRKSGRFVRSLGSVRSSVPCGGGAWRSYGGRAAEIRAGSCARVVRFARFSPQPVRAEAVRGGRTGGRAAETRAGSCARVVRFARFSPQPVRAEAVRGGRMPPCRESSGRFVRRAVRRGSGRSVRVMQLVRFGSGLPSPSEQCGRSAAAPRSSCGILSYCATAFFAATITAVRYGGRLGAEPPRAERDLLESVRQREIDLLGREIPSGPISTCTASPGRSAAIRWRCPPACAPRRSGRSGGVLEGLFDECAQRREGPQRRAVGLERLLPRPP